MNQKQEKVKRHFPRLALLILILPFLGYAFIKIYTWYSVNQDMKVFLKKNGILFTSNFCQYDDAFYRGYCTFSGTSLQAHKLAKQLQLNQINTSISIDSLPTLDSKVSNKKETKKTTDQDYLLFRIKNEPCWSKLNQKTSNIKIYAIFGTPNQLNMRYGTSYSSFILLHSGSANEGCILFEYSGLE